ncbi:MAG TPA: GHMP kinase [Chloroflexota bacterium]|jgi:D-glycero-alpha-D-manno-heptose-7-phosphate kinase|nr:GHMP kinase [Chloroflexota bacterium]
MKYAARAPLRIDFGGGWSDVPPFAQSDPDGGAVLNAAINLYATGYIIKPEEPSGLVDRMRGSGKNVVRYELDAPAGAGLGASAAQTLLWLTLVKTMIANVSERRELAERAWRVENELGILGGRQDQYASAVGGINYMTFGSETTVEPLHPGFPFTDDFERRVVVAYMGGSRLSGDIHEHVWGRYAAGDPVVTDALRGLKRVATEMRSALLEKDLDKFGRLMNQNWEYQRQLDASITNERVDLLVELALSSGAIGVKAAGAGGGGCLICLAEDGAERGLAAALKESGAQTLPFEFDWYGVHLTKG